MKRSWRIVFKNGRGCNMSNDEPINAETALRYARNQFGEQVERVE